MAECVNEFMTCNGANGTIIDIIYENNHQPPDLPIAVIVQFDDYIGPSITNILPSCVPICPVTVSVQSVDSIHERQTCLCSDYSQKSRSYFVQSMDLLVNQRGLLECLMLPLVESKHCHLVLLNL